MRVVGHRRRGWTSPNWRKHTGNSIARPSKPCIFEIRNQKVLKDLDTAMQFKIRTK